MANVESETINPLPWGIVFSKGFHCIFKKLFHIIFSSSNDKTSAEIYSQYTFYEILTHIYANLL
jgi:hypothetical protein